MKFAILVYHQEQSLLALSDQELSSIVADCGAWVGELVKDGHHVFSTGLQSVRSARTVRNQDGKRSMTDGPFAETKEFLGGFTILEASDLTEALRIVEKFPATRITGSAIEVRPLLDPSVELTDPLDRKVTSAVRQGNAH